MKKGETEGQKRASMNKRNQSDPITKSTLATLVGGLEHFFMTFHSVGNVIIPTDELIFFRGVGTPPTSTNQLFHLPPGKLT
jgi:hypothetical protein